MPRMFTDDDLDTMQLVRCAFDPDSDLQPRQGVPHPAAVRRGARPAQGRAPAAAKPAWRRCSDERRPRRSTQPLARRSAGLRDVRDAGDGRRGRRRRARAGRRARRSTDAGRRRCCASAAAARPRRRAARRAAPSSTWGTPPERGRPASLDISRLDRVRRARRRRPDRRSSQAGMPAGRPAGACWPRPASGSRSTSRPAAPRVGGIARHQRRAARARLLHGTARDLLIGITVVRADGVVAKAGGKVVKNVAGYDLGKLLTGSFGTLGVITEAAFRLHPLPPAQPLGHASPVARPPTAARGSCSAVAARARSCPPRSRSTGRPTAPGSVSVLLEGVDDRRRRPRRARRSACSATAPTESDDRRRLVGRRTRWDARRPADADHRAQADLRALPALADVLDRGRASRRCDVRGSRRRRRRCTPRVARRTPADAVAAAGRGAARGLRRGTAAAPSSVDAPADVKAAVDVWGPVPGARPDAPASRTSSTRDHRLAPGRFVGGI